MSKPTLHSLRCEYQTNPIGIDIPRPRLSWQLSSERRGLQQTAYRILVADSQETLDQNLGNIWDSKRVASSASTNVEFAGQPLEVGKTYYWKVRIWDEDNRLVDYSEVQSFTTGKSDSYIVSTENKFVTTKVKPVLFEKRSDFYFIKILIGKYVWLYSI